ncbi:UNKNOWN [Stylonychia lemnae]|uniref:LITAF domain-containing protein n=1 Tax=Stylonychia lemnae TaxID=5949 RepID=A0A078AL48_STYLE|nr:UNKNOWN [Stylonychia lemnae]|eukprot:CDW83090.1 UNKNOWN [Stylonychia lemnae]
MQNPYGYNGGQANYNQNPAIDQNGQQFQNGIPVGYAQDSNVPIMMGTPQQPQQYQQQQYNPYNPNPYPYAQQPPTLVVVRHQPNTYQTYFGRSSTHLQCPFCNKQSHTKVNRESTTEQAVACIILCICVPPYCFLPYLVPSCFRYIHRCSNCDRVVGAKDLD